MIRTEAIRQIRRLRTWVAFAVLGGLPVVVAIGQRLNPDESHDVVARTVYAVSTASGLNHALASLAFMSPFFLIVVVCMFAGESVAGEATWGTLRYLLLRPVSRARLIASKLAVAGALAMTATLAIVIAGLVSGSIAFGWHGVRSPLGPEIPVGQGILRLAVATLYVAWGAAGVLCFSFFLSTLTDSAPGAISGGIGLAIASQILDGIRSFDFMHAYLPTHYWSAWSELFFPRPVSSAMARGVVLQMAYAVVFAGLAAWRFRRKDILS